MTVYGSGETAFDTVLGFVVKTFGTLVWTEGH